MQLVSPNDYKYRGIDRGGGEGPRVMGPGREGVLGDGSKKVRNHWSTGTCSFYYCVYIQFTVPSLFTVPVNIYW